MSSEETRFVCDKLNEYLENYLKNYIEEIVNNLDDLLKNYEYDPYNWDNDRAIESTNIYAKLAIIVNSKDYLLKQGIKKEKIDSIINKINSKYKQIHEPYEKNIKQKDLDLDFLSAVFDDAKMIKQIIEYDLQKEVSEEEFMALCSNPDYIIQLFEKYVTINEEEKFRLNDYDISKDDLKSLLNKLVIDYQKKKINTRLSANGTATITENLKLGFVLSTWESLTFNENPLKEPLIFIVSLLNPHGKITLYSD